MQISSTAYPTYTAQLQQAVQAQQAQQAAQVAAQSASSTDSDGDNDGSVAAAAPVASPAPGTGLVLDVSARPPQGPGRFAGPARQRAGTRRPPVTQNPSPYAEAP